MDTISRIGMDTSKRIFQLHGVTASEQPVLRRKLSREAMVAFFRQLPSCEVAIEACGASHHWARVLAGLGHRVRLIAPQLSKPYVKRGKNDAADAEALCEAASRPTMRFVPVKTAEQQAALMLAGQRERMVRTRTQLTNTIRGHAAEFGLIAAKGATGVETLLAEAVASPEVPPLARELFTMQAQELGELAARLGAIEARLRVWQRDDERARRLARVPSIGPVTASLLSMKVVDPHAFRSGRDFAAWLGLTPKDHSTAGRTRTGRITRAGDETLRSLLVVGATSVILHERRGRGRHRSAWLTGLLARKPPKLAAVALANKTARIVWKMLTSGANYDPARAMPAGLAATAQQAG